jgi:hypothetical protein
MTQQTTLKIVAIATFVLMVAVSAVMLATKESTAGFKDAAAMLTFITGAAIAIERTIEIMWTIIGGLLGTYWPLNAISRQVKTMVDDLDTTLKPFHEKAQLRLERAVQLGKLTREQLAAAEAEIDRMKTRFDELVALVKIAPDNERMQLLAAAASQNVNYLHEKYNESAPHLTEALNTANAAIGGLQDFLATFKDNPGRRLISLCLGAVLGLGVAGVFTLDIFQAVLQTPAQEINGVLLDLRVIVTGLVIGLGSGPTHEVIHAVKEYKQTLKGDNTSRPELSATSGSNGD